MVTADAFLRRSLLAPVVVPTIAIMTLMGETGWSLLAIVTVIGYVPYLWMLWERRELMAQLRGAQLEAEWTNLPVTMLNYYARLIAIVAAVLAIGGLLYGVQGVLSCEGMLFFVALVGAFAVPVVGFTFVIVTLVWLRIFERLGLVY